MITLRQLNIFRKFIINKKIEVIKIECPNCGAKLNDSNQNFCEFCGFELNVNVTDSNKPIQQDKSRKHSHRRCCC